jgi:4'-phosphopantetheinyl transferase
MMDLTLQPCEWPAGHEVHVWSVDLDQPHITVESLARALSPDELKRADGFVYSADQRRYILARGATRTILGSYVGMQPDALRFEYGAHGKPSLRPMGGPAVHFNTAHSGELALVAISSGREVGIDVEIMRPFEDAIAVAERFFSPGERQRIATATGEYRTKLFLTYWTRKEAMLKLTGLGLSHALNLVDVSWPDEISPLSSIEDGSGLVLQLRVRDLKPAVGYLSSLAAEGDEWAVSWRRYAATI